MSDDTNSGDGSQPPTADAQAAPPPPPATAAAPPTSQTPPPQYQQAPLPDTTGQYQYVLKRVGTGPSLTLTPGLVLSLLAIAGIVLSIFLEETQTAVVGGQVSEAKTSFWDEVGELWAIGAIVAVALTLLPAIRGVINLPERIAWAIAAGGAAFLLLWWVLFVLPNISLNLAFLATAATAAAVLAVWLSPGNVYKPPADAPAAA
jgi:hypothetical protein